MSGVVECLQIDLPFRVPSLYLTQLLAGKCDTFLVAKINLVWLQPVEMDHNVAGSVALVSLLKVNWESE